MSDWTPAEDRYESMEYRFTGKRRPEAAALALGALAELRQRPPRGDPASDPAARVRPGHHRSLDLANNYGPPYGRAKENFGVYLRDDFGKLRAATS